MGKPVNRSADRSESPFAASENTQESNLERMRALMEGGESKVVEFKSTGRKNTFTGAADPAIEWALVWTIAGFMNANGGTLLVGVNDESKAVGVEQDYDLLRKKDRDGWELWLTDLLGHGLGKVAAAEVDVQFAEIDGHDVVRVEVGPASQPVFANSLKGEKRAHFFVRINNSTQELSGQEARDYQLRRWTE